MIASFVKRFEEGKDELREIFSQKHPDNYREIVTNVVKIIGKPLDWERIHEIDDGDYQGTLVYVIGDDDYQPSDYWYVKVYYGSCSGCDTLEGIRGYDDGNPTEEQTNDYMTLALHIVQGLKQMGEEEIGLG
jgi:hypothetical protein